MEILLEATHISKSYPGVKALDDVSIQVTAGEVHGLVGENGAGKSTLMHILSGVAQPNSGRITLKGEEIVLANERDAQSAGIGIVFQERSLVNNLSIMENIFAGRQPVKKLNIVDRRKMRAMASELLHKVGLDINPDILVENLSSVQKQLVEIAKALSINLNILILDESTATITEVETQTLFKIVRELRDSGISIIYISHRIEELPNICDRISVLKDGVHQGTFPMEELSLDDIVTLMVGRKVLNKYDDRGWKAEKCVLEIRNFSSKSFYNVSFRLMKGQILGMAGLAGAGRSELALALFGVGPRPTGTYLVNNEEVVVKNTLDAVRLGIGYLTNDRKEAGLFLEDTVAANIVSASLDSFSRYGFINDKTIRGISKDYVNSLNVSTPSIKKQVLFLSGGNQQKTMLARWLLRNPDILIIDEPTRGVDVGAKAEIYALIRKMATAGTSIIIISSELPEIMTLSDEIVVMWQGRVTGILPRSEASEEKLMHLSAGLNMRKEKGKTEI